MSVHPSLKTKGSVSEKRNVLKRYERGRRRGKGKSSLLAISFFVTEKM